MTWLEQKYIGIVGSSLRNFKRKNSFHWQFSCPYCGDSSTREFASRGNFSLYRNEYKFHCYKCGATRSFANFLKEQNHGLYHEYIVEKFTDEGKEDVAQEYKDNLTPVRFKQNRHPLSQYKKIAQLDKNHPAKAYIVSRRIPDNLQQEMYWVPGFKKFINDHIPDKFDDKKIKAGNDEGRVIFPFYNQKGDMFGLQGRSLIADDNVRYITIMFDETEPRFWGLNKLNFKEKVLILEGPIDAMIMRNSLASCGGELFRELNQIPDLKKDNVIIVYDNEPRHPDTIKKMKSVIQKGYPVAFWPETVQQKDVNQILTDHFKGRNPSDQEILNYGEEIRNMLVKSALSGIDAELKMAEWSRTTRKQMN